MSTPTPGDFYTLEVCVDCYTVHHTAELPDPAPATEPWALFPDAPLGSITDNVDAETEDGITPFSWTPCMGCGSRLGGSRYRMAYWSPEREGSLAG